MSCKLDEKDKAILILIQENSKLTANQISKKIIAPITTVFAKIKIMVPKTFISAVLLCFTKFAPCILKTGFK